MECTGNGREDCEAKENEDAPDVLAARVELQEKRGSKGGGRQGGGWGSGGNVLVRPGVVASLGVVGFVVHVFFRWGVGK